jgi:dipeptidyl-peptidase-4
MGHAEVEDQVDGVRWLVKQGLADPQRVGVYGWSYGGYMALMCLARAPETFQVAVAGAPVTHWDGYDTHYTERYMAMPQNNPDGYQDSSVMAHIPNLRGDLMITHGLIDENVHFRHTARLINALNRAHKPYELLIFPDERHMPRRLEDRVYMEERIVRFLKEHLIERSE